MKFGTRVLHHMPTKTIEKNFEFGLTSQNNDVINLRCLRYPRNHGTKFTFKLL